MNEENPAPQQNHYEQMRVFRNRKSSFRICLDEKMAYTRGKTVFNGGILYLIILDAFEIERFLNS